MEEVCCRLLSYASIELPPEVEVALGAASERESQPKARAYFKAILENLRIARERRLPICQDTGVPVYYITLGSQLPIQGNLREAIHRATVRATQKTPLRQQVTHPLTGENPGTNVGWGMPAIFFDYEDGVDHLDITAIPKGGGAELKWSCVVPIPGAPREETILKTVVDAVAMVGGESCTPNIVGVAVGGFGVDYTEALARRAIFRSPLNSRHPDPQVAALEKKLFQAVNKLGIGPLGVGGDTTCLGLHMEVAGTHSAVFPIAVALYCWAARYSKARIHGDGRVEYITHPQLGEMTHD
ncbi:MAG: fumarate hydratase [Chloroflexi bacterium]|nr:fumarate hydratase [Chloroflexota bacterium]